MPIDREARRLLGQALKTYREELSEESQRGFAEAIGLSPSYLSECERGTKHASTSLLSKYEHALRLTPGAIKNAANRLRGGAILSPPDDLLPLDGDQPSKRRVTTVARIFITAYPRDRTEPAPCDFELKVEATALKDYEAPSFGILGGSLAQAKFRPKDQYELGGIGWPISTTTIDFVDELRIGEHSVWRLKATVPDRRRFSGRYYRDQFLIFRTSWTRIELLEIKVDSLHLPVEARWWVKTFALPLSGLVNGIPHDGNPITAVAKTTGERLDRSNPLITISFENLKLGWVYGVRWDR